MNGRRQPNRIVARSGWRVGSTATTPAGIDWPIWLRTTERKRRLLLRVDGDTPCRPALLPPEYFVRATYSSFRLDGIDMQERDVLLALAPPPPGGGRQSLRSRAGQRVRNHVSILHRIESSLRLGQPLKAAVVVRWYTTIGAGLINTSLSDITIARLDQVVRRINSPQLRLQAALADMARLHVQILSDSLVPSFNGILARLLLRYHLGRISLPPVVFDPDTDAPKLLDETMLLARILELIHESYDLLLEST